jgi:FAD/FMN-containing dehydrogenase
MNLAPLKKSFQGELFQDKKHLDATSRDYSVFKIRPQLVACPKNTEDVKTLVQFAAQETRQGRHTSVTARAAGTDMTGGPLSSSVVVSFTQHFNHIQELKSTHVRVQPGVYFRDLESALSPKGLLYPPYPASKDLCAIGGMLANNSGGEKTLAYGKSEKFVKELSVVLSDGEVHTIRPLNEQALHEKCREHSFEGHLYRELFTLLEKNKALIKHAKPNVSKNSAGYSLWNIWDGKTFDLTQLFIGSQGTLGLITEATLNVVKAKPHTGLTVVFLDDLKPLAILINELLKHKPESLESYDDKTLTIATKFWRELVRSMKGNLLRMFWQFLPEIGMVMRGGIPKMVLLVELTDIDPHRLQQRQQKLINALALFAKREGHIRVHPLKDQAEAEKYWAIRRQSFALLHAHHPDKVTAPFIDDIAVLPKYLSTFLPELNAILDHYKDDLTYTIAGHPGNGNFHIIPLMDLRKARVRSLIPVISDQVYQLVKKYHGTITAEHNDGLIRTPYLGLMYPPEIITLFSQVKQLFDPLNIFNPNKKVGGTLKENLKNIAK